MKKNINMHKKITKRGDDGMRMKIAKGNLRVDMVAKISLVLFIAALFAIFMFQSMPAQAGTITSCADCHGNPPVDNATGRDNLSGTFKGSHNTHAGSAATSGQYGFNCEICHAAPNYGWYSHQNGNVDVNIRWLSMSGIVNGTVQGGSVAGWGSYSKGTSFAVSNNPTYGICNNTYCHSNGTAGTWNTPGGPTWRPTPQANISPLWSSNSPGCTPCHGNETGNPGNGAPWYTSAFLTGTWTTNKANSHQAHAGSGNPCNKCHASTTSTGNTITSVGNHIKRTYTVTPGPGINYTYAYVTNGGTCSSISCHGGGSMKWGTGVADCVSCHTAAIPKTLSLGTIRPVVGASADFNMTTVGLSRHLFGATTIVKWDCIVCHREGSITNGKASATYHNDGVATTGGLVHLRNVDTTNEAVGWTIDNKRWTTTDYTNMDDFCLSCHDSDGAAAVSVNATNNGIGGNALRPFNSTDWTTRGFGVIPMLTRGWATASGELRLAGSSEIDTARRVRVVDVKTQFYAGTAGNWATANYNGNPSQHAVIGTRYGTKNARWYTASGAAWGTVVLKKMGTSVRAMGETALLSCSDCHVLDSGSGAHGSGSATRVYNLRWVTVDIDDNCNGCHNRSVYPINTIGSSGISRYQHNQEYVANANDRFIGKWGWWVTTRTSVGGEVESHNSGCMICHAGYNGYSTLSKRNSYGGIHGTWGSWGNNATGTYHLSTTNSGTAITSYRFFPGSWFRNNPAGAANDGGWTSASTNVGCYLGPSTAQGFSNCTSHTGAGLTSAWGGNYGRAPKY
ncbi:MAG: hypothetical protein EPN22_02200 [Nitrospirae bacterium]|nr:MAG: hypothetical protein EPN22_02200 [Nitrospirota bacterium]